MMRGIPRVGYEQGIIYSIVLLLISAIISAPLSPVYNRSRHQLFRQWIVTSGYGLYSPKEQRKLSKVKSKVFLVCNHVTRRLCWGVNTIKFFLGEFTWQWSLVPRVKNDLGLGHQLGRRDVTCKPVLKTLRNIGLKQVKYFWWKVTECSWVLYRGVEMKYWFGIVCLRLFLVIFPWRTWRECVILDWIKHPGVGVIPLGT